MSGLTSYAQQQLLTNTFYGSNAVIPEQWFLGLFTVLPGTTIDGTYYEYGEEIGPVGYRLPVSFTVGSTVTNSESSYVFTYIDTDPVTIIGFGIYDAAISGNLWFFNSTMKNRYITTGNTLTFPENSITLGVK